MNKNIDKKRAPQSRDGKTKIGLRKNAYVSLVSASVYV